ncbi:MAG TPA: hypothetical protein PK515_03135, partial [Candidatus Cloacimonas sp.]|nr:hypothetical protein [Candidatus Cloacimonas sp.]
MKKALLITLCLTFLVGIAFAQQMDPATNKKALEGPEMKPCILQNSRTVPQYTFTRTPYALLTSYYDYM